MANLTTLYSKNLNIRSTITNLAMTTQFEGERPEAAGGAKGEVVTPQASEFQTLKQLIKQLKDVEVREEEDKIIVEKEDLSIILENWGSDYDYWVWEIEAESEEFGRINIYISSSEQSFEAILYTSKNTKVEMNNKIKNERVEEDLFICTRAEETLDEIKSILERYDTQGIMGLLDYYDEFLAPELSFLEP